MYNFTRYEVRKYFLECYGEDSFIYTPCNSLKEAISEAKETGGSSETANVWICEVTYSPDGECVEKIAYCNKNNEIIF